MIFRIEKSKIHIFHVIPTGPHWSSRPPRGQQVLRLLPKKATYVAKNFRSCKACSKLSVDIFMASWDLLGPQKSQFLQKSPKNKKRNTTPPPRLADCVI